MAAGSSDRREDVDMQTAIPDAQLVMNVYARLAAVYDGVFGRALQPGRVAAIERLAIRPGDSVLEVGIGTALGASLYPRDCTVTGVDLSAPMLEQAADRLAAHRIRNVRLLRMDAAALPFPDESFDVVYAPYVMSVVPDPVRVAREMRRVCRHDGRIVLLNHFASASRILAALERAVAPLAVYAGFRSDLDLTTVLQGADLDVLSIEKVNRPKLWSLVTCLRRTA
jgi:phosphatidylethanolamine/phosphatidyl-N-methylethanolamine N-methyltransferase